MTESVKMIFQYDTNRGDESVDIFTCSGCNNDVRDQYYEMLYCPYCGGKIILDNNIN